MQEFPATTIKGHWGEISAAAMRAPVAITKHGRPALVVTSVEDYEELQKLRYSQLKAQVEAGFRQLENGETSELNMAQIKQLARQIHSDNLGGDAPN